jgi:hypothetical protein
VIFRSPFSRASRAVIILILALGIAWALSAEITTPNVNAATRYGWLGATILFELVMLGGLQRLWVVCLIVKDEGITVRNFRGDIRLKRIDIKEVFRAHDFSGFHVAIRLKTSDEVHLDGVTWLTAGRTNRALTEIGEALGVPVVEPEPGAA